MKGFRTLSANGAVLLVAIASMAGVDIPIDMANEVVLGFVAVGNIVLRFFTNTPVMEK